MVLAGGGIKGMAHIGVLKAMEEFDIPIDYVGGTSMGAMVGAGIAFGWNYEKIMELTREIAAKKPTKDYNYLPLISLLKGKQLESVLRNSFMDYRVEDCIYNYFCVSANLSNAKQVIHRKGQIFDVVRSSLSLPGIWPPKLSSMGLLVDGGIVNNFPVDIMIEAGAKTIIGIEFSGITEQKPDFEIYPSNLQLISSKVRKNKKYKRVPGLMNTIVKSALLNSDNRAKEAIEMTDIHIKPNTKKVGLMDWDATEVAIEAGYEAAIKVFEKEWKPEKYL